jgi:putative SOS response-associated peptidase YedK
MLAWKPLEKWPIAMCGKFTAMASWADVVAFSQPLTADRDYKGETDRQVSFRVMSNLPLIVWDPEQRRRRILMARWGFPHPLDWKRPQPIHARSESIETTKAFAGAFLDGQRGIVLTRTFNEAPDIEGPSEQHTITPGDAEAIGIAFLWRKFDIGAAEPLYACVMVTVPANRLIAALPTDRMPAVLAPEDWATWLGESGTQAQAKACLKTVEGVRWTMAKEERAAKRGKPTVSDPGGLL